MDESLELKFHHYGISVPDLEASIAWYGKFLGFEVERRSFLPPVPANVAFLRRGSLRVELFQPETGTALSDDRRIPDQDLRTHGNKHPCFAVRDVLKTAETLKNLGADIVFVKQMPTTTVMFIRDNAGNLLEFFQQADLFA